MARMGCCIACGNRRPITRKRVCYSCRSRKDVDANEDNYGSWDEEDEVIDEDTAWNVAGQFRTYCNPDRPVFYPPGSPEKILELQRRFSLDMKLWHPQDERVASIRRRGGPLKIHLDIRESRDILLGA